MLWNEAVLAPLAHAQKILSWKQNRPLSLGGGPSYAQAQLKLRMRVQTQPSHKPLQLLNINKLNSIVCSVLLKSEHLKCFLNILD